MGDIADIAKSRPGIQHGPALGKPAAKLVPYKRAKMRSHEGGYFIRVTVQDKAGVFASIATHMAENTISLESIVQRAKHASPAGSGRQTVVLVTHATTEASVRAAVQAMVADGYTIGAPQVIRIERPKAA
jgi:homoserine dehydrogenase